MIPIDKLRRYLEDRVGLKRSELSDDILGKAVSSRIDSLPIHTHEEYLHLLKHSNEEFQTLLDLLVVPETWFFRDIHALYKLIDWYKKEWRLHHPGKEVHILSIPCSTGEEPYSLVMAFLNKGIMLTNVRIDAVDISSNAIEKAKKGVYDARSFRNCPPELISEFFTIKDSRYELKKEVLNRVKFSQGNICDPHFPEGRHQYDIIFCRNLLIYLHQKGQKMALNHLKNMLKDDGVLLVSVSEIESARRFGFELRAVDHLFFLTKHVKKDPIIPAVKEHAESTSSLILSPELLPPNILVEGRRLADLGQFSEAERLLSEYLKSPAAINPDLFFLMGLIKHAQHFSSEAETYFQKAVYLDPSHYEALIYLSLLAEKNGNPSQALLYRKRAEQSNRMGC